MRVEGRDWPSAPPRWRRLRRWADGFDPWTPRPADYVVAAGFFLALAFAYVGERTYAVELNRRIFRLEERLAGLREGNEVLSARVNALANRARIVARARDELGMTTPHAEDFVYVYVVPAAGARPRPGRVAGDGAASGARR